jgi:hypothetical protein
LFRFALVGRQRATLRSYRSLVALASAATGV